MKVDGRSVIELLNEFEEAAYSKNTQQALDSFCLLLVAFNSVNNAHEKTLSQFDNNAYYLQFSSIVHRTISAWQFFLLEKNTEILNLQFEKLFPVLVYLQELYMATPAQNMDHAITILHKRAGGNYDSGNLLKLMLLYSPNTKTGITPQSFIESMPMLAYAQLLAVIGAQNFIDKRVYESRNAVIDFLSDQPEHDKLGSTIIELAGNLLELAWMHCSYSDKTGKHRVKYRMNQIIQAKYSGGISKLKASVSKESKESKGKPVLAVVNEVLSNGHAMQRCFEKILTSFSARFHVVGFGWKESFDEDSAAFFDEFHYFPDRDSETITDYIFGCGQQIQDCNPDTIFYPSVGMRYYAILLSNYRLARVQAMGLGHPASAQADIDYAITEDGFIGDPALFSEKLVTLLPGVGMHTPLEKRDAVSPIIHKGRDKVHIAVSALSMKLSYPFISLLAEVEKQSEREVEFHIFVGKSGSAFVALTNLLRRQLSCVTVYPKLGYEDYLTCLNECDIYASSFPFGGTNSILDAFSLGKPVVSLNGEEPPARLDGIYTEQLELSYKLAADSKDEYCENLLKLISDEELRVELSEQITSKQRAPDLFYTEDRPDYADALYWIHQNHEQIKDSEQRIWRPPDWM